MGWMGTHEALTKALASVGADRDADGTFLITGGVLRQPRGQPDTVVMVDDHLTYAIHGRKYNLAALLKRRRRDRSAREFHVE